MRTDEVSYETWYLATRYFSSVVCDDETVSCDDVLVVCCQ